VRERAFASSALWRVAAKRLFGLGRRSLGGGLDHIVEDFLKFFKARGRDDDVVAPSVNVFGDAEESSARILLERKQKRLALNLNLVALQSVFLYRWSRRLAICPPPPKR
jgi:hypothetical protein